MAESVESLIFLGGLAALAGFVLVATVIVLAHVARAPILARMAVRNIQRRRSRLAIVVGGLMIGTAIISSSLVVGDTLEHIFIDDVYVRLHAVDEWVGNPVGGLGGAVLAPIPEAYFTQLRDDLAASAAPVDGVAPALLQFMPVENLGGGAGSPNVLVVGYNDSYEAAFGPLLHLDGREAPLSTLGPLEAYVNERAAREFAAGEGDDLRLVFDSTKAAGGFAVVRVRAVVRDWGKANWDRQPQILMDLAGAQASLNTTGLINIVRVSNVGDVLSGVAHSATVAAALRAAVTRHEMRASVEDAKAEQLEDAREFSADITQVFLMMGAFSVVSGMLLIVNVFTMLAEERKGELGIARAVGMQRSQLLTMFTLEGGVYAALAAAVGTLVGLGIGYAIIYAFGVIFPPPEPGMVLRFHADLDSPVIAFLAGVGVTYVTVFFASLHVSRLNIVRAIRDLPEPTGRRSGDLVLR